MHAAYARSPDSDAVADWYDRPPARRSAQPAPVAVATPLPQDHSVSRYNVRVGPNWGAIVAIVLLHAVVLGALISYKVVHQSNRARKPLVVELLSLPKPPPPAVPVATPAEALPQREPVRVPEIVTPEPVVKVAAAAPSPVVAAPAPPAPPVAAPAPAAAPAVVAAPPAPVSVSDLSSKMVAGNPPKYPVESRRKREQGTVVLSVLVGTNGAVAEVAVSRSSGFGRLDKAALDAVRRWRWSPTVRDGQPVLVRGYVDIPFVLNG